MRWPRRSPRLPDDARAALALGPGERVLSAARLRGGEWLAATDQGLVQAGWRVGWSAATHAQWHDDADRLEVSWLDPDGRVRERALVLDEPGLLPETVRERVTATILLSRRVAVSGPLGARVVARRQPGADELTWQVVPDPGLAPDDPRLRERVVAAVRAMSRDLGAG